MEKQVPEIIKQAVLKQRAELVSEREQLVHDIDRKIAEIDLFLGTSEATLVIPIPKAIAAATDFDASITRKITDTAKSLITPGVQVTTAQILQAMILAGVEFPDTGKAPMGRITRVVSGMGLYKGHKTHGWSLKENDPVGAGS